jgi:hypothetical protein
VLPQSLPRLLLDLQPEPLRHPLLHPADQHRGGVHAGDVDRLVSGEQGHLGGGEFLLQFQRVERVPAGPLDVFAYHGGEPWRRGGGFGEQVG